MAIVVEECGDWDKSLDKIPGTEPNVGTCYLFRDEVEIGTLAWIRLPIGSLPKLTVNGGISNCNCRSTGKGQARVFWRRTPARSLKCVHTGG